jgi:hypothetical protein
MNVLTKELLLGSLRHAKFALLDIDKACNNKGRETKHRSSTVITLALTG